MIKRETLRWFANQMERKLRKNDHKSDWKFENLAYLFGRLSDEINELWEAEGYGNMINECLDVANFAMMIANKARKM